jgi:phage tail protein X
MALVFQNIATITIPLVDETGSSSQFQLNLQVANLTALPSIISAVIGAVPGIEALSTASATGLSITLPYREDDVTPPRAGSRVERRGVWDLINVRGNRFSISIPSIRTDVVDSNGYIIRSNPLVVAFEQYLTTSSACDSRGVEIGGIVDAREVYRRSTRTSRPPVRG